MDSAESDGGWMCALCKIIFATYKQRSDHWGGTCSAPPTPPRHHCHTCQAFFGSEKEMDFHEPCPKQRESGAGTITVRVEKKSRDTRPSIDQILCRYCKEHCIATIFDSRYVRTACLPRISDQEQSSRRRSTTPTTTPAAHNKACPGLSEVRTGHTT